jgi:glycosyltransferase involved in cell wall biosynthesis
MPAWINYFAFKKLTKKPILVSTFHGLYSKPLYSQVMSKVDHMIAISNTVKDYIINTYNVPKNKITTIPRGCEEDVFNQDILPDSWLDNWYEEYPYTKDKIILTLPTRISAWKGIDSFIELIAMLDGDQFHGLVVGPTSKSKQRYLSNLIDKISALGLSNRITFTGSRNDIVNIYKLSDIVFNLSIKPEPFGRTTIEAISCGSKVIGWNHGGTKEILEDLYPSGLVTLNDINELKDRVLEVSKVDYPYPNKNTFTSKKMTEDTLKLYYQLFNRSS